MVALACQKAGNLKVEQEPSSECQKLPASSLCLHGRLCFHTPFSTVRFLKLQMGMIQVLWDKWPSCPSAPGTGALPAWVLRNIPVCQDRQGSLSQAGPWHYWPFMWPGLCLCGLLFLVSPFYWINSSQCIGKVFDQMMILVKKTLSPFMWPYTKLFLFISDAAQWWPPPADTSLGHKSRQARSPGHLVPVSARSSRLPEAKSQQSWSSFGSSLWVKASAVQD